MQYNLIEKLKANIDEKYRDFNSSLVPSVNQTLFLGVRTPKLREIAKEFAKSDKEGALEFLNTLPHTYFEENQIHGFIIQDMKEFNMVMEYLEKFIPYIDNWATCDTISPKVFKKNPPSIEIIKKWINSSHTYTVRFGIDQLMLYYLKDLFKPEYLDLVTNIKSDEYYINMMRAWFFQEALLKQYESSIIYIENNRLDKWTHNKAIQKSIESFRIENSKKEYLKSLRRK